MTHPTPHPNPHCSRSTLHFYNLKSSLSQPQMMVVAEVDDPFVPLPDDLLVNLRDSRALVDALLDSLPQSYGRASQVMGPAVSGRAGYGHGARMSVCVVCVFVCIDG